jgi:hypothetical protein
MVKWEILSKVCFLSQGHFSLRSFIMAKSRLNSEDTGG